MVKKVYKYGTGVTIPEGGKYLYSWVEEVGNGKLVWHYFLVEVHNDN